MKHVLNADVSNSYRGRELGCSEILLINSRSWFDGARVAPPRGRKHAWANYILDNSDFVIHFHVRPSFAV